MKKAIAMARIFPLSNKGALWRLLAILLAVQSIVFNVLTQSPDEALLVLIAWWGASMALDQSLSTKRLQPNSFTAWVGFVLVLWVLWRSLLITNANLGSSLLPLLAGIGLTLLATSPRRLRPYLPSLGILALLPLMRVLLIPYPTQLADATAWLTKLMLLLCGLPAEVQGNLVSLPGGSVRVASACTGLPAMLQLMTASLIFAIVFPMRFRWQNMLMTLCAVALGFLINGLRIALLAIINSSQYPSKEWWFELFHNGWPAWIFPGIAGFLFVNLYTLWLERQVALLEGEAS